MNRIDIFKNKIHNRQCVKIITGITNYDKEQVLKIIKSAHIANADSIDVSAREDILSLAREHTNLILFASSIEPKELAKAASIGADILEIGNFDVYYNEGKFFSIEEVLHITDETLHLTGGSKLLSVTIPGYLPIKDQIHLAEQLEMRHIDILQIEGAALRVASSSGALGLLEKAMLTLANTMELSRNVEKAAILASSGLTPLTIPLALSAGASIVGVGSYINNLSNELEMIAAIKTVMEATHSVKVTPRDLITI